MKVTETDRIEIREFCEVDTGNLAIVFSDPDVMHYSSHGVRNKQQIKDFIQQCQQNYRSDNFGQWGLFHKHSGEFLGVAGLNRSTVSERELIHISYRLAKPCQGKGYALEAVRGILSHARKNLGFSLMHAMIDPGNTSSRKLAHRAGFRVISKCTFKGSELNLYRLTLDNRDGVTPSLMEVDRT
ncbi:GNAT family N-acetyltransferase [Spongorhabdus nitratireducens]